MEKNDISSWIQETRLAKEFQSLLRGDTLAARQYARLFLVCAERCGEKTMATSDITVLCNNLYVFVTQCVGWWFTFRRGRAEFLQFLTYCTKLFLPMRSRSAIFILRWRRVELSKLERFPYLYPYFRIIRLIFSCSSCGL